MGENPNYECIPDGSRSGTSQNTTNPAVRRSRYFFRIILDYQTARTGHIVLKVIGIAAKR